MKPVCVLLPLRISSPNAVRFQTRGGQMAHARAVKQQRRVTNLLCFAEMRAAGLFSHAVERHGAQRRVLSTSSGEFAYPCVVRLTRLSSGELDGDNLAMAFKHVRDGVADALGIDDRDSRIVWEYAQEKQPRGTYAVRVELQRLPGSEVTEEDRQPAITDRAVGSRRVKGNRQ